MSPMTANGLMKPHIHLLTFEVKKTYLVATEETLPRAAFDLLSRGVELDDGLARPLAV
ncbi:MAG: hypothetical protein RIS32_178, partial [Actinomycetota bacterium]